LYSSGGAFTTRLQASPSASSSETYILPATDGTSGQLLSTDGNGVMSWITGIGSGDVVGPSSATDGNFVVFDDTTGKLIKESSVASLGASPSGRATFNNGVDVGVSGPTGTPGTLVFRNSSNAFTTTLQQSTSSTGNATYTWPLAAGTAGQILSTDNSGNLSWTNAGAGNVTTSGIGQVITGSIFFLSNIQVRDSGQTRNITLAAPTTGGTGSATITFPLLTGTVALLENTQTFTGAKTFQAGISLTTAGTFTTAAAVASTFSGSVTMNAAGSFTSGQLNLSGSTINYINFGGASTLSAAPTTTTQRSVGTKIVINNTFAAGTSTDSAIGVSGSGSGGAGNWQMWFSSPGTINFYAGNATATPSIAMSTNGIVCSNGFSATTSQISFAGGLAASGWALIGATATASWAAPSTTTRVDGTRIVLFPVANTTIPLYDAGIGITGQVSGGNQNIHTYISSPGEIRFYSYNLASPTLSVGGLSNLITVANTVNFVFNTGTGTKFGTGTGQKIAFWNKTPIVQPTTANTTGLARTGTGGTNITDTNTFGGYTVGQVVAALQNVGILA
jgi:hypothetical protein